MIVAVCCDRHMCSEWLPAASRCQPVDWSATWSLQYWLHAPGPSNQWGR